MKQFAAAKMTIIWCTVHEIRIHTDKIFCYFGLFFALSKFEKMKNTLRDIIILHMCSINDNHMIYGSRDMKRDRQIFLLFWTIFCSFTTAQKITILKNWKMLLEISSFYTSVPKIMIICYTVPEIWRVTDVIFIFHFGLFFALLPH